MDASREDHFRAFPKLQLEDFDREAHYHRDEAWREWKPIEFPFNPHSLPRLPEILNPRLRILSRTHKSLPGHHGTSDPEREAYNYLETMGDGVLRWYATRAVDRHGCAPFSEDLSALRDALTSNITLSHLALAYRLHYILRHRDQLRFVPQKMMGDIFEAYVGAAWKDAEERGETKTMEKWLFELFHPRCWGDWSDLQHQMERDGLEKRASRIESLKKRFKRKSTYQQAAKKRARGDSAQSPDPSIS